MRPLAALLALALLTTGCIGKDEPEPVDTARADLPADATTPALDSTSTAPLAPPEPVVVPVTWDGAIGAYVCHTSGASMVTCQKVGSAPDSALEIPLAGRLQDLEFTLSWTAANAHMETLGIMVMLGDDEDNYGPGGSATGASPLTVSVSGDTEGMTKVFIHVYRPALVREPVYLSAATDQAFHMEGTYTILVSPEA